MKDADLIRALKRMGVQTGGLICLGCGHEHNCGVHGCAVIREAAQRLEELLKYKAAIDRMGEFGQLFVEYEGCPRGAMGRMGDATIQEEALAMDMLTDVDMGRWRPVNEDVLQDLLRKAVIETGKEQNGEPLILEQLCGMDGECVKVVVEGVEPLEMLALVEVPKDEDCVLLRNNLGGVSEFYSDEDLREDGVKVYAYPPAHIDRETWENPCSVCGGKTTLYQQTEEAQAELEKRLRG